MHLFFQQIFIQHFPCSRHCVGNGDGTVRVSKSSLFPPQEAYTQVRYKSCRRKAGDGGDVMYMTYDLIYLGIC